MFDACYGWPDPGVPALVPPQSPTPSTSVRWLPGPPRWQRWRAGSSGIGSTGSAGPGIRWAASGGSRRMSRMSLGPAAAEALRHVEASLVTAMREPRTWHATNRPPDHRACLRRNRRL